MNTCSGWFRLYDRPHVSKYLQATFRPAVTNIHRGLEGTENRSEVIGGWQREGESVLKTQAEVDKLAKEEGLRRHEQEAEKLRQWIDKVRTYIHSFMHT